jgi:hypothetical protein
VLVAAYQDKVVTFQLDAGAFRPGSKPPTSNLRTMDLGPFIIWHTFFLEPHPFQSDRTLIIVGYRDTKEQAAILMVNLNQDDPNIVALPIDSFNLPSLCASFPLPYANGQFCVVTVRSMPFFKFPTEHAT